MLYVVLFCALIHTAQQTSDLAKNAARRNFVYNTYKYDTVINLLANDTTEQILDFYEDSDLFTGYPSRVHVSSNDSIDGEYPLFITATQQKGVSSWEIPLVVQTAHSSMQFNDMARTLCPHDAGPNITSVNRPLIQVTTSNPKNVSVNIKLRRVQDFYIEVNKEIELNVTPSTPKYYYFSFDKNPWNTSLLDRGILPRFNYTIPKSVILTIESDDDVCAVVSIQNNSCPVFDNEKDMLYQGYHLTITTKGGITLTQSMFPVGFYVVFIVKQSDEECTGVSETAIPGVEWGNRTDDNTRVKSFRYFWSALTVAVVYALPVVQLLSTYQHMVFQTGNQDLCYYNFLCAHPLGFLSDFNHVFSNVGYVVLGLVFMGQVRARQLRCRGRSQDLGIPQHSGLFYSMGLALTMEGLLSACYHLCPNKMNFQFDSSFMYVIAVLCMVKLYQNRHPDVNASAHSTFMLLAFIMAIGVIGIMYPSVYFWVLFTILHLGTCFYLTLKIYYVGRFKLDYGLPKRAFTNIRHAGRRAFLPHYRARAVLLALANAANWALATYGLYEHNKDLARHLLAILMGNTVLYTLFYVAMKLIHKEKIMVHTWCYFILAHAAWALASSLFLDSKTKWSETPANSRRHNVACSALEFYDTHDLWHGASAAALFLSFNMLLTVDDALSDTPRSQIPVF